MDVTSKEHTDLLITFLPKPNLSSGSLATRPKLATAGLILLDKHKPDYQISLNRPATSLISF
jgi:hypothetical protein